MLSTTVLSDIAGHVTFTNQILPFCSMQAAALFQPNAHFLPPNAQSFK